VYSAVHHLFTTTIGSAKTVLSVEQVQWHLQFVRYHATHLLLSKSVAGSATGDGRSEELYLFHGGSGMLSVVS
jgi:hypothetical protein